jgi:hypothetical protein
MRNFKFKRLYDLAIDDYLMSDRTITPQSSIPPKEFTKAFCKSLYQGATESTIDFVPSLCGTTYGLGKSLWATAKAPVESTKAFSFACYEMGKCFIDYCKTVDSNTIDGYIDQLKDLYEQFDHLSDSEKGELIGHAIGKYGVDIFAGGFVVGGAIIGGKGHPERGILGQPGYKETVDFGEYIGMWKSEDGTMSLPTTRGTIHYGKKGAHI